MFYAIYAVAVLAAVAAEVWDVTMTEQGIKAGVAVESFDWLVGQKPTAEALFVRDLALIALASAPALVIYLCGGTPAAYGCILGTVAAGARHVQGAREWAKLLKK
jgi:hypothetical protein